MNKVLLSVGAMFVYMALALFTGLIAKICWNAVMPEVFGLVEITYWQGVALSLLSVCLFPIRPLAVQEIKGD